LILLVFKGINNFVTEVKNSGKTIKSRLIREILQIYLFVS